MEKQEQEEWMRKYTSMGIVDISNPIKLAEVLRAYGVECEFIDVSNDPDIPEQIRNDVKITNEALLFGDSPIITGGHIYRLRVKEPVEEVQEWREITAEAQSVATGLTLTSNIGRGKLKKFIIAYLIFWTDASRTAVDSTTAKTITIKKRFNNMAGTLFDMDLATVVDDVNCSFPITAQFPRGNNEVWLGRQDEIVVEIGDADTFVDMQMFLRVM